MKKKQEFGQFFTKNAQYIIGNLVQDIPNGSTIVDPFAGQKDLLFLFKNFNIEAFDIDPRFNDIIEQDTLLNPPNYKNKFVVTNPPYLARNKNSNKFLYDKYGVNDLYKMAILSIMECSGGIIIVPTNFFCGDDKSLRTRFLSEFKILNINIFEETVFEDTQVPVCSFSFIKEKNSEQIIKPKFFPSGECFNFYINKKNNYTIGDNFYETLKIGHNYTKISRLNLDINKKYSNIYLQAVDTGSQSGRIKLIYNTTPYYGKISDRSMATICFDRTFTEEEEKTIIYYFNIILEEFRKEYHSMFLTNFMNSTKEYMRKRISFEYAYKLIGFVIKKYIDNDDLNKLPNEEI